MLAYFFQSREQIGIKSALKYVFTFSIISLLIFLYFGDTLLGERLLGTVEQTELVESDNPAEGTIFEHYGDRGIYYVLGWRLFLENFIWGIGLLNFNEYYYTVNHVEYMIQLAELGIIGFIFYILFNSMILKNIVKKRNLILEQKELFTYLLFVFGSILFSASVLFLYSSIAVAAIYGIFILFRKSIKSFVIYNLKILLNPI